MNFYQLPETLIKEINVYEELVKQYSAGGSLDTVKFKAIRVPMGIYEQRESETYMCRIRLPGGAISPKQLCGVANIAKKYSDRPLHFTTRQEVQIHHTSLPDTVLILRDLKEIGLSTRGGGGNTVRNIIGAFDTGYDETEVFDISPYVQVLTDRMIAEKDSWELPRKFKIAFSGSSRDRGLATVNDLGFIAKTNDRKEKGFSVYIAGGMGAKPKIATLLYEFVPDTEVYNITKALKVFFDKNGNRKNKHIARIRFLFDRLGKEEFIKKYEETLESIREKQYEPLDIKPVGNVKKGALDIKLFLGDIEHDKAILLSEIIGQYGEDILRVNTNQNLFIRNIDEQDIEEIKSKLKESGILSEYQDVVMNAVACAGANTCRLGICLSRGLLEAVNDELTNNSLDSKLINDISIKISGCPNSCGQHHIADIGFIGSVKRKDNNPAPYYSVLMGGIVKEGFTGFAEKTGDLPAKNIPVFMAEFFQDIINNRSDNETFNEYFLRSGKDTVKRLVDKYSAIPGIDENREFYIDWTATDIFTLTDKLEGECSAGLFDTIEWEFDNIKKLRNQFDQGLNNQKTIREIVVSASRALLITKGLESKTKMDAVKLFSDNFIGTHIDTQYNNIVNRYFNEDEISIEEAIQLAQAVRELYDSMDNSLKFPELEIKEDKQVKIDKKNFLDYRGIPCPMNYVKAKLVLETMAAGEILEILLDDGEPIENVPASVAEEGHKIIKKEKIGDHWLLVVKNK